LAGWFRTHPSTQNRITAALDEQRYLPEKDNYMVNTSEFERVRGRLQSIDNAQKSEEATGAKEQKRPTLKRRTNTDGGGQEPAGTGDDGDSTPKKTRPTLKRPTDPDSQ
jgi:hypothetical protein